MKIALLGDIAFLGNYSLRNNEKLTENLTEISDYLSSFDLVIGNLETPFSVKKRTWGAKSSYICTDIENIQILKLLHVEAVTLANNHMFDFGKEGLETTVKTLQKEGIHWFGIDGKDFRLEKDNNKIVFNGFCCHSTNPLNIATIYGAPGINRFNIAEVIEILKSNHEKGWLNIIAVHSGIEHINRPSVDQIKISHLFGESVPYIWYGHHPHVIQGIDKYKESLIAHSLGNFCFAGNKGDKNRPSVELNENNREGLILEIEIENNKIVNYTCTMIHIGDDGLINVLNNAVPVQTYSSYIEEAINYPLEYNQKRNRQRNEYLDKRRELRNIRWFIKRLRPRYIKLFFNNRRNSKKYKQNISQYLD